MKREEEERKGKEKERLERKGKREMKGKEN